MFESDKKITTKPCLPSKSRQKLGGSPLRIETLPAINLRFKTPWFLPRTKFNRNVHKLARLSPHFYRTTMLAAATTARCVSQRIPLHLSVLPFSSKPPVNPIYPAPKPQRFVKPTLYSWKLSPDDLKNLDASPSSGLPRLTSLGQRDDTVRLSKRCSELNLCSRREADAILSKGRRSRVRIFVNGEDVTHHGVGYKVPKGVENLHIGAVPKATDVLNPRKQVRGRCEKREEATRG